MMMKDISIGFFSLPSVVACFFIIASIILSILYSQTPPDILFSSDNLDGDVSHRSRDTVFHVREDNNPETNFQFSGSKHDFNSTASQFSNESLTPNLYTADELLEAWEAIYNLTQRTVPKFLSPFLNGKVYPLAPHLQQCHKLTKMRMEAEKTSPSPPNWRVDSSENKEFRIPWIHGADEDNLPLTRFIQAQIWKNQFPQNCSRAKFALLKWLPYQKRGLGSQLHTFSHMFKIALSEGRTAVEFPSSFTRARRSNCKGENLGSLRCFFFGLTSTECENRAVAIWNGTASGSVTVLEDGDFSNISDISVLKPPTVQPWMNAEVTTEIFGTLANLTERQRNVNFWHAQILRFVLRWPSAFLCHELNKIRQEVFGQETAGLIAKMHRDRLVTREAVLANKGHEAEALRRAESLGPTAHTLENDVWWELPPFVPRPIVSVYVRQGDKGREMKLFSLPSYMFLAERLKTHTPNVRFVWLSTEMQSVVEAVKYFPDWKFYFTGNKRQRGQKSMFEYTIEYGPTQLTLLSFANLIISAECDFFVAPLASNWGRLINELRQTGGKLKAGFLAVNYDEW